MTGPRRERGAAGSSPGGLAVVLASLGRWSVRHRWLVVGGWLAIVAASLAFLPTIGSVVKNDSTAFLPPSAPSVQATHMVERFGAGSERSGTMLAVRVGGPLSSADQGAFSRMEASARRTGGVTSVRDVAVSSDEQARTAEVQFTTTEAGGGPGAAQAVDALRAEMSRAAPPGLAVYLTGPVPELVDQQSAASHTANRAEIVSAVLIVLLLLLAFRSPLAPLVTVAPAVLALGVASPVIAESTHIGVQISSLMELLLTALVLGAGTDYGLFLIFRYRENLRRGLPPTEAIVAAVERVGESITFSALTVIAALLTLVVASFGLYRGVGPGLAIGIAVVLLVGLTFFPALLAVLGRAVFWPNVPRPGARRAGRWGTVAARVTRRPLAALAAGTAVLAALAGCLVAYAPSGFDTGGYITGSNSGLGEQVLEAHFGAAPLQATGVVLDLPTSVWRHPQVIAAVRKDLASSGQFATVTSPLEVAGIHLRPHELSRLRRQLGPAEDLPAVPPPSTAVPVSLYEAYRATASAIDPAGRSILFRVSLAAGAPSSTAAMQAMPEVRRAVAGVAHQVGAVRYGVAGDAASAADVSSYSASDVARIAPIVLVVLALLLAIVLRSLVAPLYLVASVALSFLASLGLAVLIFVVLGGQLGVNFTLPFFSFVFIMALGEDYNILVMSRIREECARLPMRRAVAEALSTTGSTVTSAGLVLAGTFGVLVVTTTGQVQQIGAGLSLGVLLDTFLVRTLLVPSAAALLGRWNWWPSALSRRPVTPPPVEPARHDERPMEPVG